MPRLLQRPKSRPLGQPSASNSGHIQAERAELPTYQPLLQPLNEASKRKLHELANARDTRRLGSNIDKSIKHLQVGVGNINDRGSERRAEAERRRAKAEKDGASADTPEQDVFERNAARAEEVAREYTKQTEATLRQLIDLRAQLEDGEKVFAAVHRQLEAQPQPQPQGQQRQRRKSTRREVDSDGEEMDVEVNELEDEPEEKVPTVPLGQMFETARKEQADEYAKLTMHQRYGLDNDYIQFKRTWHDAQHQDNGIRLPDATKWFDRNGEPVIELRRPAGGDAEDEDDDLVVAHEVRSFKCPLSLQWIKEPYSNRICPHTFDKENILGYLQDHGGSARCPEAGCNQELSASDFFYDEVFLRKSKRAMEAARAQEDSDLEEDVDTTMTGTREVALNLKKERPTPRRRPATEDVDDEV